MLKVGQKVIIKPGGWNASDFYESNTFRNIMGVYDVSNVCDYKYFEVIGQYKPIKFEHDKEIYGAYPIGFNGITIGHVYNTGLIVVEGPNDGFVTLLGYGQKYGYDYIISDHSTKPLPKKPLQC